MQKTITATMKRTSPHHIRTRHLPGRGSSAPDPLKRKIAASDAVISEAIKTLLEHERGRKVLADLHVLFNGPAQGLDITGQKAAHALVVEFFSNSRRGFLDRVVPPAPKSDVIYNEIHSLAMEGKD